MRRDGNGRMVARLSRVTSSLHQKGLALAIVVAVVFAAMVIVRANMLVFWNSSAVAANVSVQLSNSDQPRVTKRVEPGSSSMFVFLRAATHKEGEFRVSAATDVGSTDANCGYVDSSPTVSSMQLRHDGSVVSLHC